MSVCTPDEWEASAHSQGTDWPSLELDIGHTANQSGACVPAPYLQRSPEQEKRSVSAELYLPGVFKTTTPGHMGQVRIVHVDSKVFLCFKPAEQI